MKNLFEYYKHNKTGNVIMAALISTDMTAKLLIELHELFGINDTEVGIGYVSITQPSSTESNVEKITVNLFEYFTPVYLIYDKTDNKFSITHSYVSYEYTKIFNIKIKYFSDEIERLRYIDGKSDWIDLRSAKHVELKAGEFQLIPLGIAMELPEGYEAHVVPRGSTFKNYGIIETNSMGIIDETYCGDNDQWFFPAYALRDTVINVNDRICQFRIQKHQPPLIFSEVAELDNPDRGGHGSTGKQ